MFAMMNQPNVRTTTFDGGGGGRQTVACGLLFIGDIHSQGNLSRCQSKKKIEFLQNIKVNIVWMTSVSFLSAEGENYPWKRGDKSRGEKICF